MRDAAPDADAIDLSKERATAGAEARDATNWWFC
jgi:hypothetical protein